MRVKLSDIAKFSKGVQINGDDLIADGEYIYLNGGINPSGRWNTANVVENTVTISEGGNSSGYINYITEQFWCGAHCYYLHDGPKNTKYLYYALKSQQERLFAIRSGACMPNIKKADLGNFEFEYDFDEKRQNDIVDCLDKMQRIIEARQQELQKLDELVKARFVEMFGDPLFNSLELKTLPMTEVCEIIDGDRGKNYPTADEFSDEGYCLFLNAKNVTTNGFNFDNCMYVTKEKDEALRKGRLSRGDVVLTTRGTLGNLAFYTDEVPFEHVRINSGMVILRMKKDIIDESFFIEQFRMQLNDIKEKIASGSAQPQLPISTMNKIQILIPDIDKQREFAAFVKQLDKSKFDVRNHVQIKLYKYSICQNLCDYYFIL